MIIIQDSEKRTGITFFHPLLSLIGEKRITVIPWTPYNARMKHIASLNCCLMVIGAALLFPSIYNDLLYNLFVGGIIFIGIIKLWIFRKKQRIMLTEIRSCQLAPIWVAFDFGGYFFTLTLMEIIYAKNTHEVTSDFFLIAALLFFALSALPLINIALFKSGVGKRQD